tara:strand:- start:201 stop:560 length:360 start_codon:yes stop_codon:yes gene_type:complete
MKITKTQLKQIIKEELAALKEVGDVYGHQGSADDPRGTSMPLQTDAPSEFRRNPQGELTTDITVNTGQNTSSEQAGKNIKTAELLLSWAADWYENNEPKMDAASLDVLQRAADSIRGFG